jgi:hypothetical protein
VNDALGQIDREARNLARQHLHDARDAVAEGFVDELDVMAGKTIWAA